MMKQPAIAMLVACIFSLCGCQSKQPHGQQYAELNNALVQALNQSSVDEAVIVQHTVYPYHFVRHSSQLNSLGARDLGVLLGHYLSFPSPEQPLNLRRGSESEELYAERIQTVVRAVTEAGIEPDRISIRDAAPGGAGMVSDRVILILTADRAATVTRGASSGGTSHGASR